MISLAGGLSVPAGVLILALTAHPALRRPAHLGGLVALQVGLFVGIIVLGGVGLAFPEAIPAVPKPKSTPAELLFGVGGTALLLLISRAVRTYRLTRRAADLAVALGCTWLGVTLYANLILGSDVRLLLGARARDRRRRARRRPRRAGHQARRRLAPAGRRPHRHRAGRRRGGLPRPARARPDGPARAPRRLDRGAHPPRRPARRPGRRGAQALRRRAPPARRRRPAARHRQALRAAGDPQQARQADRRRSSPRSSATRATAASCWRSSAASRRRSAGSSPTITSASTAAATRAA